MPTLMDLRNHFANEHDAPRFRAEPDESLIADIRGRMTPAQVVETKLRRLLLKPSSFSTTSFERTRKAK